MNIVWMHRGLIVGLILFWVALLWFESDRIIVGILLCAGALVSVLFHRLRSATEFRPDE